MPIIESRLALIPYLAQKSPQGWIGRTQLMKFFYFLQILRGVPLGYRFTLYAYGPFDSTVLGDLGVAEALGWVQSAAVGYGYRIESRIEVGKALERDGGIARKHKDDLDWVIRQFGKKSIADLELESTIVYVARSPQVKQLPADCRLSHVAQSVSEVKPRFSKQKVAARIRQLQQSDIEI